MTTVTYRPTAAGTYTNVASGDTPHWDAVNEVSADDNTTYISTSSASYQVDTYNFANPTQTGTINSITLYFRCAAATGTDYGKAAIYVGSTLYYGSEEAVTTSWTTKSKTWTTNPATSSAWSWSDLNSLEIGVALKKGSAVVMCTQVYLVIDYTATTGGSYAVVLGL